MQKEVMNLELSIDNRSENHYRLQYTEVYAGKYLKRVSMLIIGKEALDIELRQDKYKNESIHVDEERDIYDIFGTKDVYHKHGFLHWRTHQISPKV